MISVFKKLVSLLDFKEKPEQYCFFSGLVGTFLEALGIGASLPMVT